MAAGLAWALATGLFPERPLPEKGARLETIGWTLEGEVEGLKVGHVGGSSLETWIAVHPLGSQERETVARH